MPVRYLTALAAAFAICTVAWAASAPRIVGDEGATIEDLIREQALVTVVLNNGAREPNFRLRALNAETLGVTDGSGAPTAFKLSDIQELRVQKGRVEHTRKPRSDNALTTDDRRIVDEASARAFDIFNQSRGNQVVRALAATALAVSGHESRQNAEAYVRELSQANDAPTAVYASMLLFAITGEFNHTAIGNGLQSGDRGTKALAILLAGLSEDQRYLVDVRRLLKDPTVEIFPAAALSIARLGDRDSLPALYDGIRALSDEKGEACVTALTILNGPDVRQRMLTMLPDARGNEWYRIVRVLHALGDEQATELLRDRALRMPAFQESAALILAEEGSVEAIHFLRGYLEKSHDPNAENLIYKGAVGIALYKAGDIQAKSIIQDVLNTNASLIYARGRTNDEPFKQASVIAIQAAVCSLIGNTFNRELLSLLSAPIQSSNPGVAVAACIATMSIANPEFGTRGEWLPKQK